MTASFLHKLAPRRYTRIKQHLKGVIHMKEHLLRFTLRVPQDLLDKLAFIAKHEGKTKNEKIEQIIKQRISEFEKVHGPIQTTKSEPDP